MVKNLRKSEQLLKSGQALIVLVEDNQRLPANLRSKHYLVSSDQENIAFGLGLINYSAALAIKVTRETI